MFSFHSRLFFSVLYRSLSVDSVVRSQQSLLTLLRQKTPLLLTIGIVCLMGCMSNPSFPFSLSNSPFRLLLLLLLLILLLLLLLLLLFFNPCLSFCIILSRSSQQFLTYEINILSHFWTCYFPCLLFHSQAFL